MGKAPHSLSTVRRQRFTAARKTARAITDFLVKCHKAKRIALFHGKQIRRTEFRNKWWFVVNDVVTVLTDTPDAKDYIRKMRDRDPELSKGWGQIVTPLTVQTST